MNKQMILILAVGAIGAYLLLKPKTPTYIPPVTGNVQRDNKAATILAYAAAAGATATAIANLIAQINNSNDSQVDSLYQTSKNDPGYLADLFG